MKFARLKQFATGVAFAVTVVLSLGMGVPVAAMSTTPMDGMAHDGTSITNCISQHHITPGASEKIITDELKDKDDEPSPKPLPYFVQFQGAFVEEPQTATQDIVRSSSYCPPDILKLTSNIRF